MSDPMYRSPDEIAIALQEERKLKKQRAAERQAREDEEMSRILVRPWLQVSDGPDPHPQQGGQRIKIMTWNILAQCLVRRELFPTSDCLKASQREPMLYREMLVHDADIICMQEVDRSEKVLPILEQAGYSHTYACGPRKKHGCLIAYRREMYEKTDERVVFYDDQEVRQSDSERSRRGSSFLTRNIGLCVALRVRGSSKDGVVIATTHLFWHPSYIYERARQAGLLFREVSKFCSRLGHHWPRIICGDFNFAPNDPAYSLLVGDSLTSVQDDALTKSRVVHRSIDPSVPIMDKEPAEYEDAVKGEHSTETDPDRIITNARCAVPTDGLLTTAELVQLFNISSNSGARRSAYDDGQRKLKSNSDAHDVVTCGERYNISLDRRGRHEPMWTSYTHYWKTVLDYIFIVDPPKTSSTVVGLLRPPRTEELDPGMPRHRVSGSDHVSLVAELQWPQSPCS